MSDWGLIESFHIDDGQLDGVDKAKCFVLGYEFATICTRAERELDGFHCLCHSENADRIARAMDARGRKWRLVWSADDEGESWLELFVAPAEGDDE